MNVGQIGLGRLGAQEGHKQSDPGSDDAWRNPHSVELPLQARRTDLQEFINEGLLSKARVTQAGVHAGKMKSQEVVEDRKKEQGQGGAIKTG